jgi:signal peptidase I
MGAVIRGIRRIILTLYAIVTALLLVGVRVDCAVGNSMSPGLRDGDPYVYRLCGESKFKRNSIVVMEHRGLKMVRVLVAIEGDLVVINEEGLFVNNRKFSAFERFDGVERIFDIKAGDVFVTSVNTDEGYDSVEYGPVSEKNILGTLLFYGG